MATAAPSKCWLFEPVSTMRRYKNIESLRIHVMVFDGPRVLLVRLVNNALWITPSRIVKASEDTTYCAVALSMLRNAIEERKLPDLQFTIRTLTKAEIQDAVPPDRHLNLFITLKTKDSTGLLDKTTLINHGGGYTDLRWQKITSPSSVSLALVTMAQITAAHTKAYEKIDIPRQMVSNHAINDAIRGWVSIKRMEQGDNLDEHQSGVSEEPFCGVVTYQRNIPEAGLFFTHVTSNQYLRIYTHEMKLLLQPVEAPGGKRIWEQYDIIGVVRKETREKYYDVATSASPVLFSNVNAINSEGRLEMKWLQWTKCTEFRPQVRNDSAVGMSSH